MSWTAYQIILRLHSPLHIGYREVGYLRRTRPYVTGRALRGALVNRVGRNQNIRGEDPGDPFRAVSKTFAQYLTFTYFYPALNEDGKWRVFFPWEDEAGFRRRFLSSYTSTALAYPHQTAAEGLLHETEFISPRTLDTGEPVYLMGYIFVEKRFKQEKYDWVGALRRLQLGGERGYGWGDVRLVGEPAQVKEADEPGAGCGSGDVRLVGEPAQVKEGLLFDKICFRTGEEWPVLTLKENEAVLAHTFAENVRLSGPLEPIVGREWRAGGQNYDPKRPHIGQYLNPNGVFFAPGSVVSEKTDFEIVEAGYWRARAKESQP